MFKKNNECDLVPHLEGIKYKTLTFGEKTSLSEFYLDKGVLSRNTSTRMNKPDT